MERVDNSVKRMNTNVELVTLLHQEKATLIMITAIPVKFTAIYEKNSSVWAWNSQLPIPIFISMLGPNDVSHIRIWKSTSIFIKTLYICFYVEH